MATHASRNTTTGLEFEKRCALDRKDGVNISKTKLRPWAKEHGVDVLDHLSWSFLPDEAYFLEDTNEVVIYEKKFQQTAGSADEKLGNCAWKISEYRSLFSAMGIENVSYIFIFNDWFKQDRYKKLLAYIKSVPGCDYFFAE